MEQENLFGESALVDGVATSKEPETGAMPESEDAHARAAARVAELRHELDYHAYRYYILDAPEIIDAFQSEDHALPALSRHPAGMMPSELMRTMGITPGRTSNLLKQLEQKGLVVRTRDEFFNQVAASFGPVLIVSLTALPHTVAPLASASGQAYLGDHYAFMGAAAFLAAAFAIMVLLVRNDFPRRSAV